MANRGKNRPIDDADLLDAARPGERFDDEMDDKYDEQGERREASGALAEGEAVGPWTDQDEEPNAFDAASGSDPDSEFEELDEEDDDLDFEALDGGSVAGVEPTDKRRREH
jgi:hypothetical protein